MSMFEVEPSSTRPPRNPIPMSEIDCAVTAQLVVAWAGEGGEEKRLGWWRSDLISEFGGMDLFRRLLPGTWAWAILQGAREAARRKDAELRRQDHNPDRILSLFSFSLLRFRGGRAPGRASMISSGPGELPRKRCPVWEMGIEVTWNRDRFADWLKGHGDA
jgi:hypothetical protein